MPGAISSATAWVGATTFLHGRAWTHAEGPTALFEQSVAWLRRHRVLLPGVRVLERLVASVRERADERLYATVVRQAARADSGLARSLAGLLEVPEGARLSELERLRQAPKRQSGTEMVRALKRVDDLARFGLGRVEVSKVPVRRMKALARYGAGSKAPLLARLAEPRRNKHPGERRCAGCCRMAALSGDHCRLCWNQARANARTTGQLHSATKASHFLDGVGAWHQLFFAQMVITRGARTTPAPKYGRRGRPAKPAPPATGRPRARWKQLLLFNGIHHDFTRFDEDTAADSANPWLAWARYLACRRGEARGWRRNIHAEVDRALVIVLSGFADGDTIGYCDLAVATSALGIRTDRIADVLTEMGILVDDRRPPLDAWLQRKLDGLTEGIARPVEAWVRTLHDGGPRSKARHPNTAKSHLNNVRPLLLGWSACYDHLREVTRDDVLAVLEELHGTRRHAVLVSLRSPSPSPSPRRKA
jgi:hypothetical protein